MFVCASRECGVSERERREKGIESELVSERGREGERERGREGEREKSCSKFSTLHFHV